MTPLVFSHANSYGAGTYAVLFEALRQRGLSAHAVHQYGHDPRYPVTSNWPHLVQQLIDFATPLVEQQGARFALAGRLACQRAGRGQKNRPGRFDVAGRDQPSPAQPMA